MRRAFYLGRFHFRLGAPRFSFLRYQQHLSSISRYNVLSRNGKGTGTGTGTGRLSQGKRTLWAAALTPAAFIRLSEEDNGDGKTPEEHMLEASRAEIKKGVPEDLHGLKRASREIYIFVDGYVYEPIATGLRFLHLVLIFVPVMVTIPVIWFGRRLKNRNNERSGTIWWYVFLVHSMERAGPAFIKVFQPSNY